MCADLVRDLVDEKLSDTLHLSNTLYNVVFYAFPTTSVRY